MSVTRAEGRGPRAEGNVTFLRAALCALLVVLAYGCRTTAPVTPKIPEKLHGVASWYGEEFAGRTTANGEIFDPALLTAAHRTFPFGTVLDVTNPKTGQTVRVRVNDRGPYIGGRVLDLSYAAAQQIGLIEPGIGEVDIALVHVGSGEREPPVPFEATVAAAPKTLPIVPPPAADVPNVEPVAPNAAAEPAQEPVPNVAPVVVDKVQVETQRAGTVTRTQVAADGRTLEEVPVEGAVATPTASSLDRQQQRAATAAPRPARTTPQFLVQVGAFAVEANAKSLQERLLAIGQRAWIDHQDLFRVRLGPFDTRDQAIAARAALEAAGLSAIIVAE